jgi:NADPH:quinone reductase-like Zn-dependent oxidoreductase
MNEGYPARMRAAYIQRYGKQEKVMVGEVATPMLQDDDVMIEIRAAGVNPLDFRLRNSEVKFIVRYSFPLILGHDLAGIVCATGKNVTRFTVGDKVFSRPRDRRIGTFAQYLAVHQDDVALMPQGLSFSEAAALPLVSLAAWQALVENADVKRGDRILIHAGAGGFGLAAIQLAKYLGAVIYTTASKSSADLVRGYGADEVIDYRTQQFDVVVKDMDVVVDTLGGNTLNRSFAVLRPGGCLVSLSGTPDRRFGEVMHLGVFKTLVLTMYGWGIDRKAKKQNVRYVFMWMHASGEQLSEIAKLVAEGKLRPHVDREFPLEQTQAALDYVESQKAHGKVIVHIQ